MQTKLIAGFTGVDEALFGIGLSYGTTSSIDDPTQIMRSAKYPQLLKVARSLAHKQGGHNKFLESIVCWLDIKAPRYWWQEFDTYRVGITKQSESTIHTAMYRLLTVDDFEPTLPSAVVDKLNAYIKKYKESTDEDQKKTLFLMFKSSLPEGFIQRRIVCLNAKTLQNMWYQRKNHKLPQWHEFFGNLYADIGTYNRNAEFIKYCVFGEQ